MALEIRLVGPPGTGKTTRLARHVEAAARKYGREKILVSSFTKAAARVIATRVDLADDRVATLHAHAFRALGRPSIAEGRAKEWNESPLCRPSWILSARSSGRIDDPLGDEDARGAEGDPILSMLNLVRARMLPPERWPSDVSAFAAAWSAWKLEAGALDFTDLIERAFESIEQAPGEPIVGIFDEVQDWSPLELALVRKWGAAMGSGFILAGDPDQVLYEFKGASPRSFHEPAIPADRYEVLEQSFRVPRRVHAEALAWIRRSSERVDVPYFPTATEGRIERGNDGGPSGAGWGRPAGIVERALEDLRASGRSQMILASCSFMLGPTIGELKKRGVPFWNPYRTANGQWNPLRGGSERIAAMLRAPRPDLLGGKDPEKARLWTWGELWRWIEPLSASGLFRRGAGRGKGAAEIYAGMADKRDELVEAEALRGLIFEEAAFVELRRALEGPEPWRFMAGHLLASWSERLAYAFAIAGERGPEALVADPAVIIGTIHSVKGGEAHRVSVFPDLSPAGWRQWLGGGDDQDGIRRMFYVAMTRASEELFLAGASQREAVSWER